jgi:hypothetical protein
MLLFVHKLVQDSGVLEIEPYWHTKEEKNRIVDKKCMEGKRYK